MLVLKGGAMHTCIYARACMCLFMKAYISIFLLARSVKSRIV